jgi:hypothetical protein
MQFRLDQLPVASPGAGAPGDCNHSMTSTAPGAPADAEASSVAPAARPAGPHRPKPTQQPDSNTLAIRLRQAPKRLLQQLAQALSLWPVRRRSAAGLAGRSRRAAVLGT